MVHVEAEVQPRHDVVRVDRDRIATGPRVPCVCHERLPLRVPHADAHQSERERRPVGARDGGQRPLEAGVCAAGRLVEPGRHAIAEDREAGRFLHGRHATVVRVAAPGALQAHAVARPDVRRAELEVLVVVLEDERHGRRRRHGRREQHVLHQRRHERAPAVHRRRRQADAEHREPDRVVGAADVGLRREVDLGVEARRRRREHGGQRVQRAGAARRLVGGPRGSRQRQRRQVAVRDELRIQVQERGEVHDGSRHPPPFLPALVLSLLGRLTKTHPPPAPLCADWDCGILW